MSVNDTIVAVSTPPGRGGIGVIRISGEHSLDLTRKLVAAPNFAPQPNLTQLKTLRASADNSILDQALVTYFKAPRSFTGEEVVELSCHGSPVLLQRVVDELLSFGARNAQPGEFTLRAIANNRINLSQAEAVRDLINAQTTHAALQAARQLNGELSFRLQPLKERVIEVIVTLESSLEFVEDDLPDFAMQRVQQQIEDLIADVSRLADTFRAGRLLKSGFKIALVGRPNVGKSSVFNGLLSYERAIVTDVPGTTRDSLSEHVDFCGVPVLLTDTAGIRTAEDKVERLGIERTRRAIVDADLVIAIFDGSRHLTDEDEEVLTLLENYPVIVIINKSDLKQDIDLKRFTRFSSVLSISTKTRNGLAELTSAIENQLGSNGNLGGDALLITNARHYDSLRCTIELLNSAKDQVLLRASEELVLVGLYGALRHLGEITGETTPEDVLTEIFSTFCIGK